METPFVERDCTIEYNGKKFESGSAVVTENYIVAYVSNDFRHIQTWHGDNIGDILWKTSWRTPRSWMSSRQYQVTARVNRKLFTGRTNGEGMCITLKIKAQQ